MLTFLLSVAANTGHVRVRRSWADTRCRMGKRAQNHRR